MDLKDLIKKMKYKSKDMMPPTSMKGMAKHAMKSMAPDMREEEKDEEEEMEKEKGSKKESEVEIEIILNGAKKKKK